MHSLYFPWGVPLSKYLNHLYALLMAFYSLSALIENKVFSVHGGLSPAITTLDQVSFIDADQCFCPSLFLSV